MHRITDDILKYLLSALMLPVMLLVFSSCRNDDTDCPEPNSESGRYRLQFRMVTRANGASRADDVDEVEGSAAENYIDVNDVHYFIFDSNKEFVADLTTQAETVVTNDAFTVYDVVADVSIPFFIDNIDKKLDFYILALANYKDWGATVPELEPGDGISKLFDNGIILTELPFTSKLLEAANTDAPADERQVFPLSGLQRFTFTGNLLVLGTDEDEPFDITSSTGKTLNMQRVFTKVEIIDKIDIGANTVFNPEVDKYGLRLKDAQINGYFGTGCMLPEMFNWQQSNTFETQQVIVPTMPDEVDYHEPPALVGNSIGSTDGFTNYSLSFSYDAAATEMRSDKCPVYSCYLYEFNNAQLNGKQIPYITVTIENKINPETGGTVMADRVFVMKMCNYTDGVAQDNTEMKAFPRNVIYRYEIVGISQNLNVNWTVCDMDHFITEIEFN